MGLPTLGLPTVGLLTVGLLTIGLQTLGLLTVGLLHSGTADIGTADSGTADSGTVDSDTVDIGTVDSGTADIGIADDGPCFVRYFPLNGSVTDSELGSILAAVPWPILRFHSGWRLAATRALWAGLSEHVYCGSCTAKQNTSLSKCQTQGDDTLQRHVLTDSFNLDDTDTGTPNTVIT